MESSSSVVETICRRVKRWQGSDYGLPWVAYRHLPLLLHNVQRAYQLRCTLNAASLPGHSSA